MNSVPQRTKLTPAQLTIVESINMTSKATEAKEIRKLESRRQMEAWWQQIVTEAKTTRDFFLRVYIPVSGTLPLYHPTEGILCKLCFVKVSTTIRNCGHSFCAECFVRQKQFAVALELPKIRCVSCPQEDATSSFVGKHRNLF